MKLIKGKLTKPKIVVAFHNGVISIYDTNFKLFISKQQLIQNGLLPIINLPSNEILLFDKTSKLSIRCSLNLDQKVGVSLLSLQTDDYLRLLYVKSRVQFLQAVSKQKIDFFLLQNLKKQDSWDYFFNHDIVGCGKNKEGSKLFVWDDGGNMTLFNFLKHIDNNSREYSTPMHSKYESVNCIEFIEGQDG